MTACRTCREPVRKPRRGPTPSYCSRNCKRVWHRNHGPKTEHYREMDRANGRRAYRRRVGGRLLTTEERGERIRQGMERAKRAKSAQ